jgi:hypothetical protein
MPRRSRFQGLRNSEISFILDGLFPPSGQERTVRAQDDEEKYGTLGGTGGKVKGVIIIA